MRQVLVEIHRWAGFVIGLAFAFIMVTGIVVAVWEQWESRIHFGGEYLREQPAEIGRDLDQLIGSGPAGLRGTLFLPNEITPVYEITQLNNTGTPGTLKHYYSQDLELLGTSHSGMRHPILDAMIDWHVSLVDGQRFTPYIGIIATVIALIALYIWWPFRRGFDWKVVLWPKDFRASNLLMNHATGGMISVAFLILLCVTGAFIGLRTVITSWAESVESPEQVAAYEIPSVERLDQPWQSWEVLVENAYAAMPEGAQLATIAAERVSAVIDFRFRGIDDLSLYGASHIYMNPYTGEAVHRYLTTEGSGVRWLLGQSRSLHTGEHMSTAYLVFLLLGSVIVTVIAFTGCVAFVRRLLKQGAPKVQSAKTSVA